MSDIYVTPTGNDSTGDGSVGNPYATPGKAGSVWVSSADRVLIKAGTYTLSSTSNNVSGGVLVPPAGTSAAPSRVAGYNTTVGDLYAVSDWSNFPVLAASASFAVSPINLLNAHAHVYNLDCNAASQSNRAVWVQAGNSLLVNVRGRNALFFGLAVEGSAVVRRCQADGNGSSGAAVYLSAENVTLDACTIAGNTNAGVKFDGVKGWLFRCLIAGNTGASSDGLVVIGTLGPTVRHCVFRGNGRDGVRFNDASGGDNASVAGCIIYGNTGYGINSASTAYTDGPDLDYNAFGSNTAGARNQVPAGAHDVTLTGDPFTASGSGDYSLNATAGAGAACRAAGFPGVFPGGLTTGYADIGAAQHQDAGGGGSGGGSGGVQRLTFGGGF